MNKFKCIIPVLLFVLLLSSCKNVTHTTRRGAFIPDVDIVRLNLSLNDFEIVGETEITVSYHKYLGVIIVMDKVNGAKYDPYNLYKTTIKDVSFGISSQLDKAASKIINDLPNATYYHIVYKQKKEVSLILGKEIEEKALIRAYNIKYGKR